MPNPTLYDNFSQVKQYIDQNQVDLSSYVSKSELNNASYATTTYVADYVAEHGGSTVIDENIIPKANNIYNLGSSSYQYAYTYTYWVGAYNSYISVDSAHGWKFNINDNDRFYMANSQFRPITDKYCNLGTSSSQWKATYTDKLFLNGTNIRSVINGMFSYDSTTGTLTITTL